MNLLLVKDFDPDLVDTAGESLLALVYCRQVSSSFIQNVASFDAVALGALL